MISSTIELTLDKPFGNLTRGATVLIAVRDAREQWIFGGKQGRYPEGICRMIGGGINAGESPAAAAAREMHEEMGLRVRPQELHALGAVKTIATTPRQTLTMTAHLFFYALGEQPITASDDLSHFVTLDREGFAQLIRNYRNLPATLRQRGSDEDFAWRDYGRLYGEIHRLVFQELAQRGWL